MIKTLYCQKCSDELEQFGELVTTTYNVVCSSYSKNKTPFIHSCPCKECQTLYLDIIYLLERKGFLKTADFEDHKIKVLPIGYNPIDEDNPVYLFCSKNH